MMNKWKRALALLLAAVLTLVPLTGCGSGSAGEGEWPAEIQKIVDRGVLKVGVKNSVVGFGYQDILSGEFTGLEVDLAKKIADYLGVDVEYTTVTAATRGELIDSGDLDCVLATFTITDERREHWDFSTAYYTDYVAVLVENSSGITSLESLEGAVVGVSSGSTSARALVAAIVDAGLVPEEDFDADTFDPSTWTEWVSFQQYDDYPTISTGLSSNEVQAFCVDKSILAIYNTDSRSYIDEQFSPQEYGIVTAKGSALSDLCDELVNQWLADGTLDELIAQYGLE